MTTDLTLIEKALANQEVLDAGDLLVANGILRKRARWGSFEIPVHCYELVLEAAAVRVCLGKGMSVVPYAGPNPDLTCAAEDASGAIIATGSTPLEAAVLALESVKPTINDYLDRIIKEQDGGQEQ